MSETQDSTENVSDVAGRLHSLCEAISKAAGIVKVNGRQPGETPLASALPEIAKKVGFQDDRELRDQFLLLCQSVEAKILVIRFQRENVRDSWLKAVRRMAGLFDAKNYLEKAPTAVSRCFSRENMAVLETISERLLDVGQHEKPLSRVRAALETMRDTISEIEGSEDVSDTLVRVFRHLLQQMETAVSLYEIQGDEQFWREYKLTIATFIQAHEALERLSNWERIKAKVSETMGVLAATFSTGANAATVAAAVYPALSGGVD